MSGFQKLRFYATAPHPCSYLTDREATTLFVEPDTELTAGDVVKLAESGFRRSGRYIYRPHCEQCNACISVRIPVHAFYPKRRQRRTIRRNQDITFKACTPVLDETHYALYDRYIRSRHADGDMFPPSVSQYQSFLTADSPHAFFLEAYQGERLIAVTLFDEIPGNGLSAIYTFFDPDPALASRSLGRMMVLQLVEVAKELELNYLYLGYWIRDCDKMAYKTEYRPIEMLINSRWIRAD